MATAAQAVLRVLQSQKSAAPAREPAVVPAQKLRASDSSPDNLKIVLQPRLCTLRSYGPDRSGVIKTRRDGDDVSPFFATLSEYIESSKKSQDFEIISGRLAMIVFAATVTMEMVTGNSLFRKMDLQGIAEAGGVCVGAVACAAVFAWFSSARNRVGRIFTISCNTFIDSLIDQIIDGLFYESESNDWSDEI
ncbi:stress enhanced protein 2, chloroplastic [Vitis riparia]|uniref:stress enhanced protein 2, chloroplastic n=1 Tax=Vitis riparia TaxID=96939 RepID=UPI00155AE646|nr:stress enhanced protein 2, chloroplastic [Vitis riparia]